jgi:molybdopterin molybdotransferase
VSDEVAVAILPTGDELVSPGQARKPGQTYECNETTLTALARQFGGTAVPMGIAPDDMPVLKKRLGEALTHPVVITAGGMSMGSLDLVPQAARELGITWLFHGVNMRPGKPVAYGRGPQGQNVVGLPGNPVSVFVCAWLFVRMIVRGLQGLPVSPPPTLHASLAVDLPAGRDPRPAYLPGRLRSDGKSGVTAEPVAWSGSDDPFGLAEANCLLVRQRPHEPLAAGAGIECMPIRSEWD